jgi:hypothetical protein
MRQAALETLAVVVGVVGVLTLLAIGGAIALYIFAGCLSATCI